MCNITIIGRTKEEHRNTEKQSWKIAWTRRASWKKSDYSSNQHLALKATPLQTFSQQVF